MLRERRFRTAALAAGFVAVLASVGWWLEERTLAFEEERPIVVIADDNLPLRVGNGVSYPSRYEVALNRGVEARKRYERGGWVLVELAGGETGWVPRTALAINE